MALGRSGFPAIPDPRSAPADLRQSISNIRQRIEAIEANLGFVSSTSSQGINNTNVNANDIALLKSQLSSLLVQLAALQAQLAALTAGGSTVVLTGLEDLPGFRAVFQSAPGIAELCDPSDPTRAYYPIGVTTGDFASGQPATIQTSGTLTIPGAAFTPDKPVLIGLAGALVQTLGSPGALAYIGKAMSATQLEINPSGPYLNTDGIYDAAFDDFLPITRGAVVFPAAVCCEPVTVVNLGAPELVYTVDDIVVSPGTP